MGGGTLANWNGVEMPLSEVRVSVLDRAFVFGDAVYEVVRIYGGRPWLLEEHLHRLESGLAVLEISCDLHRFRQKTLQTLSSSGLESGIIYMQITRGEGERSHVPAEGMNANELIYVEEKSFGRYKKLQLGGCRVITRADPRWGYCRIKSTNLLGNCLAQTEAKKAGCEEAVLLDADGFVLEGSHTNVFAVMEGQILTPSLAGNILPGITRGVILKLARSLDLVVHEASFALNQFMLMHEVFLTGTVSEIVPVVSVDGRTIGDGRPGEVTWRLLEAYRAEVQRNR